MQAIVEVQEAEVWIQIVRGQMANSAIMPSIINEQYG